MRLSLFLSQVVVFQFKPKSHGDMWMSVMELICSGGSITPTAPVPVIKIYLWLCGCRFVICSVWPVIYQLQIISLEASFNTHSHSCYTFLFFHLDFISLFWSTSKVAHAPVYFRAVLADLAVVLAILRKLDLLTETLSQEKPLGYVKEDFLDLHFCSIDWEVYFGKYRIFNCLFWFSLFLYK